MSIKLTIGVLFLFLFSTNANAEGWWSAFARSPETSVWRISLGQTLSIAKSGALMNCGNGCNIELTAEPHQCMAIVEGAGWISWYADQTLARAVDGALGICNENSSGCVLAGTECGTNKILLNRELILHVQGMLSGLGFYTGRVNGTIDFSTQKALEEYRKSVGIKRTGQLTVWDHNWITRFFYYRFRSRAERHAILNQPDT